MISKGPHPFCHFIISGHMGWEKEIKCDHGSELMGGGSGAQMCKELKMKSEPWGRIF